MPSVHREELSVNEIPVRLEEVSGNSGLAGVQGGAESEVPVDQAEV